MNATIQLATFGVWELVLILLIVVVIFGAGKLPQLGESMGKAIRNFRQSFKGEAREVEAEAQKLPPAQESKPLPPGQETAPVAENTPASEPAEKS